MGRRRAGGARVTPDDSKRTLYESMGTGDLLELRAAFEDDYRDTTTDMGKDFCRGRLALIADVLRARDDAARKAGRA